MTELQAAVGIGQLKRVKGYVECMIRNAQFYNEAVEDCPWITVQRGLDEAEHVYHIWGATFHREKSGISLEEFKKAVQHEGGDFSIGYTNVPVYQHTVFKKRVGYGQGCPWDCPLYKGNNNQYPEGTCPEMERVMPNVIFKVDPIGPEDEHKKNAKALRRAWQSCNSKYHNAK
jgi:dTDP-4-amino-4,6-dideoxygalactose transaminase